MSLKRKLRSHSRWKSNSNEMKKTNNDTVNQESTFQSVYLTETLDPVELENKFDLSELEEKSDLVTDPVIAGRTANWAELSDCKDITCLKEEVDCHEDIKTEFSYSDKSNDDTDVPEEVGDCQMEVKTEFGHLENSDNINATFTVSNLSNDTTTEMLSNVYKKGNKNFICLLSQKEQEYNIKFCIRLGKTVDETYRMLSRVHGTRTLPYSLVLALHSKFLRTLHLDGDRHTDKRIIHRQTGSNIDDGGE